MEASHAPTKTDPQPTALKAAVRSALIALLVFPGLLNLWSLPKLWRAYQLCRERKNFPGRFWFALLLNVAGILTVFFIYHAYQEFMRQYLELKQNYGLE